MTHLKNQKVKAVKFFYDVALAIVPLYGTIKLRYSGSMFTTAIQIASLFMQINALSIRVPNMTHLKAKRQKLTPLLMFSQLLFLKYKLKKWKYFYFLFPCIRWWFK